MSASAANLALKPHEFPLYQLLGEGMPCMPQQLHKCAATLVLAPENRGKVGDVAGEENTAIDEASKIGAMATVAERMPS
eukprot:s515_g7.t1